MIKYNSDQILFMTIDMFDGQIIEISKNILNILDYFGVQSFKDIRELSFNEKKRYLNEILSDF